jgi:ribosomal protein L11 methyltransferase
VRARDSEAAERAVAEALEAGASGLEEREEGEGIRLLLYAPESRAHALRRALEACEAELRIEAAVPVPERDWSDAWKAGLSAVEVSARLRVRPSFVVTPPAPGQVEVVIDPGQAFGTGGHASTLLALEWVAAVAPELPVGARVLDVGCGTGVLALAALSLGARRAVAFDLDPLAGAAARENSRANTLEDRVDVFVGPIGALRPVPFDLVLANLLESELMPLLPEIAARTAFGGRAVLSGLLESQRPGVLAAAQVVGLRALGARECADANGDRWTSVLVTR